MSSTTIYTDQTKKTKPSFKEIEVPPRKLLVKKNHRHCDPSMMFFPEDITTLHKFLPFNNTNTDADSDPDSDPYASDHFRIYEFKIRRCTRSRSHDWTDCPFAHPGEKARRRDPRRFHYSGTVCSEYRRAGTCSRGDDCEFAHGVFECWLHPSRYRTEACKDGKNCKRKVCFFAHSPRQLRILPEISTSSPKYSKTQTQQHHHHCCMYCHGSINSSPTSTLLNMSQFSRSPSLSPPLSPVKHNFSPISSHRFTKLNNSESLTYKDVLNELISSLDNINLNLSFNDAVSISSPSPSPSPSTSTTSPWLDVIDHHHNHTHQPQFVPSPSTPSPSATSLNYFANNSADPDLGWVNDLLM